jgi:hypothetical protein
MNEALLIILYLFGILQGIVFGFIKWAPETTFKKSFVDGLSLKFLWNKK